MLIICLFTFTEQLQTVSIESHIIELKEGSKANFSCKTDTKVSPITEYTWYINGEDMMNTFKEIQISLNRSINGHSLICEAYCPTTKVRSVSKGFLLDVHCEY